MLGLNQNQPRCTGRQPNDDAPNGNATDLSGNTRAAKVCDGTNPQYGDSRQTDLERRQRGAEQFGAIADSQQRWR